MAGRRRKILMASHICFSGPVSFLKGLGRRCWTRSWFIESQRSHPSHVGQKKTAEDEREGEGGWEGFNTFSKTTSHACEQRVLFN